MTSPPACRDCGLQYASAGWADVIIPDETWEEIVWEPGETLLCFTCIARRLRLAGVSCPVMITSGPFIHDPAEWWNRGVEHGRWIERGD